MTGHEAKMVCLLKRPIMNDILAFIPISHILLALVSLALGFCLWTRNSIRRNGGEDVEHQVDASVPAARKDPPLIQDGAGRKAGPDQFLQWLSASESSLVLALARKGVDGGSLDLDSVNHLLGLASKRTELQKAYRSRVVGHINATFRTFSGKEDDLVQRMRIADDRRTYEYSIEPGHAAFLLSGQSSSSK